MGLSIRAYARHRGISHVAVQKAVRMGRIPLEPDGSIDPARADAAWMRTTDPARKPEAAPGSPPPRRPSGPRVRPVTEAAVGSVRDTLREHGLPTGGRLSFIEARTAHEIAKAHLARLRLQERKGELVDRAGAAGMVFRLAREERDAWVNWPARVAALMASELGVDAHAMQQALETHVRAHLGELADVRPDLR